MEEQLTRTVSVETIFSLQELLFNQQHWTYTTLSGSEITYTTPDGATEVVIFRTNTSTQHILLYIINRAPDD